MEFALPSKTELCRVIEGIIESAQLPALADQDRESALDAACGLTTIEAEQISGLRNWAKERARLATSPPAESRLRRLVA